MYVDSLRLFCLDAELNTWLKNVSRVWLKLMIIVQRRVLETARTILPLRSTLVKKKFCLTREINSIINVKPLSIPYLYMYQNLYFFQILEIPGITCLIGYEVTASDV